MVRSILLRCCFCGREGQLFAFALLAEVCRKEGFKLMAKGDHFHPGCSRRVFDEIQKKSPYLAYLRAFTDGDEGEE